VGSEGEEVGFWYNSIFICWIVWCVMGKSGLFSAASGSANDIMNRFCWIRDNYYLWLTGGAEVRSGIEEWFGEFIDYNVFLGKFDGSLEAEYMYVHPLCTRDIQQIDRDWAFVQSDTYGNLLEVMSVVGDRRRADIMLGYLEKVGFWDLKDYGFWECDNRIVHASSLAACLRGIEKYESSFSRKVGEIRVSGYDSLRNVLGVGESLVRESDLALFSLLWPGGLDRDVVDARARREIFGKVGKLEEEFGYKRFFSDDWDGLVHHDGIDRDLIRGGHEMQWLIGWAWKYLYTGKLEDKDRVLGVWEKYGSPEGFVPADREDLSNGWVPNCTPFLCWTFGMQMAVVGIRF